MTRSDDVINKTLDLLPTMILQKRATWLAENNPGATTLELALIIVHEINDALRNS